MRDYRKCAFYQGSGDPKNNGYPVVSKVCLKMSLENVVKDIPLISNNSWTYGDLMVTTIGTSSLATKFLSCIGVNSHVYIHSNAGSGVPHIESIATTTASRSYT